MTCKQCGAVIPEGATLCEVCGADSTKIYCPHCGNPMDGDSEFCFLCGKNIHDAREPVTETSGKKKTGLLIAGIIGGVVALILILGLLTNWFGLTGPAMCILRATEKTVVKSGNFTVQITLNREGMKEKAKAELQLDVDWKKQDITMYWKTVESEIGIYKGYLITRSGLYVFKRDISDEIEEFFEAYEDMKEEDIDWEELLELAGLDDTLDADKIESCVHAYFRKLNSESWLKQNAGYEKTKQDGVTMYSFEINGYDFLSASLPLFEKAFQDEDDYADLADTLEESEDYLDAVEFNAAIGLQSGYLSRIEFEMEGIEISVKIADVNKTKVDTATLKEMLSEAEGASDAWG